MRELPIDLLDKALDMVWVIDQNEVIEYVNPAVAEVVGYRPEELIGKPLRTILPPTLGGLHGEYVQAYVRRGGGSDVLGRVREFMIVAKSGEAIPVELKAFEIEPRGELRRFGAIMCDIRERRRLEEQRNRLLRQLEKQARVDELTELPNRRAFFEEAGKLVSFIRRHGQRAAVAIVDLDHFKAVNDTHGHACGDHVLREIGQLCHSWVRAEDLVARLGGEEFGVLLPGIGREQAALALQRLRKAIEVCSVPLGHGKAVRVTASIGVAEIDLEVPFDDSLFSADRALYRAKSEGRNRVAVADRVCRQPMPQHGAG